jgi:hypothetical protein
LLLVARLPKPSDSHSREHVHVGHFRFFQIT